jgi:small-conductance mechanosensitive channel
LDRAVTTATAANQPERTIMKSYSETIALLETFLQSESTAEALAVKSAIVIGISIITWLILRWGLHFIKKRTADKAGDDGAVIAPDVFDHIQKALKLIWLTYTGTALFYLWKVVLLVPPLQAVMLILIAAPAKNILIALITILKVRIADRTDSNLDDIVFDLLSRFAGVLIYLTAVIMALDRLNINVMPFIAGAGVAGVAVGFAAKDTLSNLIAGVLLIIDRPFEVGDRIEIWSAPRGSATWGDVIDIGLRATKIRTTDHLVIIIPNNEIMLRDIVNYTQNDNKIRVRINIGISYDANIQQAKDIIIQVANSLDWTLSSPPPKVVVRNFGESSVDLQLRVWIGNARKRMDTISEITDQVKMAFDEAGIEIPYPKREITIIQQSDSGGTGSGTTA